MISFQEYAERRQKLMTSIGPGSIAILPAAKELIRNGDGHYAYRQNSDFYYLTGFPEPEAIAVFIPGREEGEFILFCRDRDPAAEIWTGFRAGQVGACEIYGADQAFSIHEWPSKLPSLLTNCQRIYFSLGQDEQFDAELIKAVNHVRAKVRAGIAAPNEFIHLGRMIHEMRLRKSAAEIELMREAAKITASGHRRAMQACKPGMKEYQLEAELLYEFYKHGSRYPAYTSIVGGGANACILHYIENTATLNEDELVLIDAGCEFHNYASDVTRTFPVNGKFSAEQGAIYELVLAAQLATIAEVKPGTPWNLLQQTAIRVISEGLLRLGILKGSLEEVLATESYRQFYMHNIGHWLGLDTHDVGDYKQQNQWRLLEPGMVLTVEPGIYIQENSKIDKKWWNIGIRIEDDVLVTANGCEILTADVPKEIGAIEKLMASE